MQIIINYNGTTLTSKHIAAPARDIWEAWHNVMRTPGSVNLKAEKEGDGYRLFGYLPNESMGIKMELENGTFVLFGRKVVDNSVIQFVDSELPEGVSAEAPETVISPAPGEATEAPAQ